MFLLSSQGHKIATRLHSIVIPQQFPLRWYLALKDYTGFNMRYREDTVIPSAHIHCVVSGKRDDTAHFFFKHQKEKEKEQRTKFSEKKKHEQKNKLERSLSEKC